jgi:PhnB protein
MAITPYLLYEDVGAALQWLSKAFGLRKLGRPISGRDGKINHAAMRLGEGEEIMLGCPGPGYKNPKALGQATQNLYVTVADVDKHFKRAEKAGAKILERPTDTFYGHRRYGAEDPEGHRWYFAQDIPSEQKARPARGKARPKRRRTQRRR